MFHESHRVTSKFEYFRSRYRAYRTTKVEKRPTTDIDVTLYNERRERKKPRGTEDSGISETASAIRVIDG